MHFGCESDVGSTHHWVVLCGILGSSSDVREWFVFGDAAQHLWVQSTGCSAVRLCLLLALTHVLREILAHLAHVFVAFSGMPLQVVLLEQNNPFDENGMPKISRVANNA